MKKGMIIAALITPLLVNAQSTTTPSSDGKGATTSSSTPSNDPYKMSNEDKRNIEKRADRVSFLQDVYKNSAKQGSITFESLYEDEKPISLSDAIDFKHPQLQRALSSLDEKERDEILEATRDNEAKNNRLKAIMNEASKYGMSAGMYETARYQYKVITETFYESLYQAFPYYAFMLEDGKIKPPLIDEIGAQRKIVNKRSIHEIKRTFQVAEQAEVILSVPSYVDDMQNLLQIPRPKIPAVYYMPINEEERAYWEKGLVNGWEEGNIQANRIIAENTVKILRKMLGYIRFHSLVDHNMITKPTSQNINIGINSSGDVVNIGESTFEITQLPTLSGDDQSWIAIPMVEDIFGLLNSADNDSNLAETEEEGQL